MPVRRADLDAHAYLRCPRDGDTMGAVTHGKVQVDRCGTCRGTWFDAKELRRVADDREVEKLATRIPIVKVPSGFACPRCGGECVEGQVHEVTIDHCLQCNGVWLDAGELAEAARQVKVERALDGAGGPFRAFLSKL